MGRGEKGHRKLTQIDANLGDDSHYWNEEENPILAGACCNCPHGRVCTILADVRQAPRVNPEKVFHYRGAKARSVPIHLRLFAVE
jgi:hypothetical protein